MSKSTNPPEGKCQPGYRNKYARKPTQAQRFTFRKAARPEVSADERALIDAELARRAAAIGGEP
ncbi:hypothetical protein [Nitrospirillum amazonense]|uniref:hypothetical protein n=1 Tax=Nitrospirillum amazonense TaxID=28077 RepID=UPI0024129E84|nr:hypothetical protein [Nitrospirillum amazonense]MDG3444681.1 hypothetical protein [Nitrospirillum amazonense]